MCPEAGVAATLAASSGCSEISMSNRLSPYRLHKPTASPTNGKAGTAFAVPIIPAHSAENIDPADRHQIFVERK
jgi:hypothetical protein